MTELKIQASRNQIEEFKESVLWADIVNELNSWKEGFAQEQELLVDDAVNSNLSSASVLLHMGDLNGRKKAVDYMISIPDIFLSLLTDKVEGKKNGRNKAD